MPFTDRATTSKALIHNPTPDLYFLGPMDSKFRGSAQEMQSEFTNEKSTYAVNVNRRDFSLIACH